jgi:radical SAM superfamily enzyme YgiQ (UPF0313 family)
MHHAYKLKPGVKAFMPPQGLLVVAAYLPIDWQVRFVDENKAVATDCDFRWASAVLISGMHVQRPEILEINRRAHAAGKLTVLGGPSVSASPEWYRQVDILHCGELGDATNHLIARLEQSVERPREQEIFKTIERLPLDQFPVPAYEKIDIASYFLASIQASSGCPYKCEFCDIPALYGHRPRLKRPDQVTAELDAIVARGNPGAVYFVDDNFIANPRACLTLLRCLAEWQKVRGYPVQFACEATLNMAQKLEILEAMREAYFTTVFCGIETPEEAGLDAINKPQNKREPILDSVRRINSYGLEVVSGIILGIDSDTPQTAEKICEFVEESGIPMLTVNMLHALPKTPLWSRLDRAGRLVHIDGRESNVQFLLPYEQVESSWLECIRRTCSPNAIYKRFDYQIEHTYPFRKPIPPTKARLHPSMLIHAVCILCLIFWHIGVRSDYRKRFWQTARPCLRKLQIAELITTAVVSHHMILFARDCQNGTAEKCFYSEAPAGAVAGSAQPQSSVWS